MLLRCLLVVITVPSMLLAAEPTTLPDRCYLFTSFRGNGEDGLHLSWSTDALHFTPLNGDRSFIRPTVGKEKLMRDPCILRGPDNVFRMVWTDSWTDRTVAYSSSTDLIHWTPQKTIPVMMDEPGARNCWAPEVVYDDEGQRYLIFWATTIPGKFPLTEHMSEKDYNHRMYCTTTTDFETFEPTRLFYDGGFNVIDATFIRGEDGKPYKDASGKVFLVVKDETLKPVKKHLRIVTGESLEGPWTAISEPITESWVEGPTAIKVGDEFRIYYDRYRDHAYGAISSTDLVHWQNISNRIDFPKGSRHGTVLPVSGDVVKELMTVNTNNTSTTNSAVKP